MNRDHVSGASPQEREAALFEMALDKAGAAREAFLRDLAAEDAAVYSRLKALLAAHEQEDGALGGVPETVGRTGKPDFPDALSDEAVGRTIGRYKLLEKVGEGGCGAVYVAEQTEPVRRRVALKVIKLGMDTKAVVARFEAERQALALMGHPNIARVFDAGSTETGRPYFVMELVRGIKITEYCDANNLSTEQRLNLFIQVCHAIQHAHQKGIIHRDIKPSNILVTLLDGVPVPKVIDFGIAKATEGRLTEATVYTQLHQLIGTPAYMSPEQAEMTSVDVDTRSDVYSLGVLLYELLTGRTPFDTQELLSEGIDAMRRRIRETEPLRPSTRLATLKPEELTTTARRRSVEAPRLISLLKGDLDWVVMKCLEKDRARRYDTANGLAMDVDRYLADEPVGARPPSKLYRLRKSVRRHKRAYAAAAAIGTVLVLGALASTWEALRARRAERAQIVLRQQAQASQKQSEKETAKAGAISDFLQQMLRSANPDNVKGADYTVRQMLDDFSAGMGRQLGGQPEVEATVRATIGRAYSRLGAGAKAQAHHERALALRLKLFGPQDERVAESQVDCAWSCFEQNEYVKGEKYARAGLAIYQARHTTGRPILFGLWVLQKTLAGQERFSEVEAVTEEARRVASKTPEVEFPEMASMVHGLAEAKNTQSQFAEAESLARRALEMHRRVRSTNDVEVGWALSALGQALEGQQKHMEAVRAFRDALGIFRRQYSPGHKSLDGMMSELTKLRQTAGDTTAMELLYRDVLATQRVPLDQASLAVAETLHTLASIYRTEGKQTEAEKALGEALEMLRLQSEASPAVSAAALRLAETLGQMVQLEGSWWDPEPLYDGLLAVEHRLLNPSDAAIGVTVRQYGDYLRRRIKRAVFVGQLEVAEREARSLVDSSRKWVQENPESGEGAKELGYSQWQLAEVLVAADGRGQAESVLGEAVRMFETAIRNFPTEPLMRQELAHTHRLLADLVAEEERMDEAERQYRVAIALYAALKTEPAGAPFYPGEEASTRCSLAQKLEQAGRLDAAAAEYRRVISLAESGGAELKNDVAWRLVNNADAGCCDRSKAVLLAEQAVSATSRINHSYVDTLAAACAATGQFTNAITFEKEALLLVSDEERKQAYAGRLKLYESNLAYRDPGSLAESASALLRQQKCAQAERVARQCLAIQEHVMPDHWQTFNTRVLLGSALLGEKKYAEAEPLLLAGYEGMEQRADMIPLAAKPGLKGTLELLVQLAEQTDRPDKVAKWKQRLADFSPYPLWPAFSPDSRVIAVPRGGIVTLVDPATSRTTDTIPALGTNAEVSAYSPDGSLLVSGGRDGTIRVWSCAEHRLLRQSGGQEPAIRFFHFQADGARLFCVNALLQASWWDTHTWERACRPRSAEGTQIGALSPDGRLIAAGAMGFLRWFKGETGELLASSSAHDAIISGVAFSREASRVATVARDGTAAIWDASSFQLLTRFKSHRRGAYGVAFSPDGRLLATGGGTESEAVKLWKLPTCHELMTLPANGSLFFFVAFSPDGKWLAARPWNGDQLHVWPVPSAAELEAMDKGPASAGRLRAR